MTFTDRTTALLIHGGFPGREELLPGIFLIADDPTLNYQGWDSNKFTLIILDRPALTATELAEIFPIGTQLIPAETWWITKARRIDIGGGIWRAEIDTIGWASARPAKVTWGSSADQQSAENIATPEGTYDKVATHEATPSFTVSFLTEDASSFADTDSVGRAKTLPLADPNTSADIFTPSVPATVWSSLTEYVFHWPNGWILMGAEVDLIPGTTVGLVTWQFKYVRDITPG